MVKISRRAEGVRVQEAGKVAMVVVRDQAKYEGG